MSSQIPAPPVEEEAAQTLDPAQQSLADALNTSFFVLKAAMAVMLAVYAFSGCFSVKPQQKAVRLLFGSVVANADGSPREYEPGTWHFGWPFPLERLVRVPTARREVVLTDAFMPRITTEERPLKADELANRHPTLNPAKDGSLVTSDANLAHVACKAGWEVRAGGIKNFVTQVGAEKSGDLLVRAALERATVHVVAGLTAEKVLARTGLDGEPLAESIQKEAQLSLPADCGIEIKTVDILEAYPPLPTRNAFAQVSSAQSEQDKALAQANQYAVRTLGDVAGPAQAPLHDLISLEELASLREGTDSPLAKAVRLELARAFETLVMAGPEVEGPAAAYTKAVTEGAPAAQMDAARTGLLAALTQAQAPGFARSGQRIEGRVRALMSEAEAYRTSSAQALYAESAAFKAQLAQYRANPLIFKTRRWQAAREKVFTSPTVETFFVPTDRLHIETGRDPETAGKVDDILLQERKRKAGVDTD